MDSKSAHRQLFICKNEALPIVTKSSDFSIDHILNKAGNVCETKPTNYLNTSMDLTNRPYFDTTDNNKYLMNDVNGYPPILDWLHYTRYRPPRIPRPARNGPTKRTPGRLPRIPFTPYQLNELETAYSKTNYLSSEDANKLAGRLELTCIRVKIWFQNRRARERREKREIELRSSSPPQLEIPAAITTHPHQSIISSSGL